MTDNYIKQGFALHVEGDVFNDDSSRDDFVVAQGLGGGGGGTNRGRVDRGHRRRTASGGDIRAVLGRHGTTFWRSFEPLLSRMGRMQVSRRAREEEKERKRTDRGQTASDGLVLEGRLAGGQGVVLRLDGNARGGGKVVLVSGGGVAIVIVRVVKTLGRAERQRGDVGRRAGHGCFSKESVLSCPVVNCIY
jgi:hypothetical protein